MRFGVALGRLRPEHHLEASLAAESLGFESVWLPEHLVFPIDMAGSPFPGHDHPPVPPTTPVFDAFAYLAYLAGRTERIRLGTHVYLMGLRHPFIAARAIQTLDHVSGGRAEIGIGAGWLEGEWQAAGLDFASRGRRLDETLHVCKRLWTEERVAHRGEFVQFDAVCFEPKPVQRPWPPILVGGESPAALRRAAAHGDGWLGMEHTAESVAPLIERLRSLRGSRPALAITVGSAPASHGDVQALAALGVGRLIVAPWSRSADCVAALEEFADRLVG